MKDSYKLLVIGDVYDNHIIRYLKHLRKQNTSITIDVISVHKNIEFPEELSEIIDNLFFFVPHTCDIKIIRGIQRVKQFNLLLKQISLNHHYDVLNIHYPKADYSFSIAHFRLLADKVVLTPWGSDVYRSSKYGLFLLKKIFSNADYVCCTNNRFGQDIRRIFNLPICKQVNLDIGSDTIDYIFANKNIISPHIARKSLALEGDFFITCGYNGHRVQRHQDIVQAIYLNKDLLPKQLTLLFPMTYPKDDQYVKEIRAITQTYNLRAYFFTDYLSVSDLFALRQSTDMFIHIQTTDANAASVQEYLALEKNVINGSWLRYDELEIDSNIPYHVVEKIDCLDSTIAKAYQNGPPKSSSKLLDYIESYGWNKWIIQWDSFFKSIS